jgi:hypothetical protein
MEISFRFFKGLFRLNEKRSIISMALLEKRFGFLFAILKAMV